MLAIRSARESGVRERVTEARGETLARARVAILTGHVLSEAERLVVLAALDAYANDQRGVS